MVVDLATSSVVVRPQRRQHGKALLLGSLTFGVTQHVFVQSVWVATLEVQSECDVAVCVDLKSVEKYTTAVFVLCTITTEKAFY